VRHIKKLDTISAEATGNIILLATLICAFLSTIVCSVLDYLGIFYLALNGQAKLISASIVLVLVIISFVIFFCSKGKSLNHHLYKYYLLFVLYTWLAINCSIVYFHATLLLIFPLLIARCYNSTRIMLISVAATVILICITPIIAYRIGGMDVSFPLWFLTYLYPNGISEEGFKLWHELSGFSAEIVDIPFEIQLLLWVSFPRLLVVISLIIASFAGNYAHKKSYERQIKYIYGLQDSIIDSMSEVIENRDSSTGGHVKRTQSNVSILVERAKKDFERPEKYWNDVIKSAAMHDLGKIAVGDMILNKPGKLTSEEFDEIKKHPLKSKTIIDNIFVRIKDPDLLHVAENVALYHHEKYDGSGYPEGLKGDEIPLEARIMAIADVYDALVSERCYKQPYTSEEAYNIIKDSMGTHFDPKLWKTFDNAFPELVKSYT